MQARNGVDGTLSSRFECKYLIPHSLVAPIRQHIGLFTRPDRFAASRVGLRYPICSLYLDSADLKLYGTTVRGLKNRHKLRVRTYSDDPRTPVFFEVKKRMNEVIRKTRACVGRVRAMRLLNGGGRDGTKSDAMLPPGYFEFRELGRQIAARPTLKVRYTREAYEARGGDPVRITFDRDLMYSSPAGHDLRHGGGEWWETPLAGVIMEIKFTERSPRWVHELIETFQLQKRSVAKYVLSIDAQRNGNAGASRVARLG